MNCKKPYIYLISVLILSLLSTCKIFTSQNKAPEITVIFPSPPDTARIQFLTSISSSKSISGKQSNFRKFIFGEEKPKQIAKPSGICMRYGKIYVCDIGLKGLEIIDLEKKSFNYFKPGGKGELKLPLGCYVDEKGRLYIADGNRKQIVVFDSKGEYLNSFGELDNFKPTGVYVSDDKIWVANVKGHSVYVYDMSGKFLYKFPELEDGEPGYLRQPTNIWLTNDQVYVSDFGDFNIKVFGVDNKYIESIGTYGKLPGQFTRPKGIAVDQNANLYAVDAAFENVQIFNDTGQLLMHFGGSYTGPGFMSLPIGITIDYDNLKYFEKFTDPEYDLKYLILVTNQYGPDKLNIYGRVELKDK